jgi:hypothetical protein
MMYFYCGLVLSRSFAHLLALVITSADDRNSVVITSPWPDQPIMQKTGLADSNWTAYGCRELHHLWQPTARDLKCMSLKFRQSNLFHGSKIDRPWHFVRELKRLIRPGQLVTKKKRQAVQGIWCCAGRGGVFPPWFPPVVHTWTLAVLHSYALWPHDDYVSELRSPTGLLFITQVIHEHG